MFVGILWDELSIENPFVVDIGKLGPTNCSRALLWSAMCPFDVHPVGPLPLEPPFAKSLCGTLALTSPFSERVSI